jgi:acyl carrier protein
VIGRLVGNDDLVLDTWLMSCRVLGRQVEEATLHLVISQAKALGAKRIIGVYRPTAKNKMVENHYSRLGFQLIGTELNGTKREQLVINECEVPPTFIAISEG